MRHTGRQCYSPVIETEERGKGQHVELRSADGGSEPRGGFEQLRHSRGFDVDIYSKDTPMCYVVYYAHDLRILQW